MTTSKFKHQRQGIEVEEEVKEGKEETTIEREGIILCLFLPNTF